MPKKRTTGHLLLAASTLSNEPKWYKSLDFYLSLIRRSLAEFFGTALFVFIGVCSTRDTDMDSSYDVTPASVTSVALGHGLGLMSMVAAFGHISGGHFNPAVSTGAFIAGKLNVFAYIAYFFAQIFGAIVGSLFVRVIGVNYVYTGVHMLSPEISVIQGIFIEMMLTCFFVSTILNCATDKASDAKHIVPLCVGLSLAASIFAGFHTSGASLNPARSFGPVVAISGHPQHPAAILWQNHYVYWIGPLLGALIAGIAYRFIFSSQPLVPLVKTKTASLVNEV